MSRLYPTLFSSWRSRLLTWGLPLLSVAILAGQSWAKATEFDYRVQEDARQHVFWMLRYLEPTAFPNDLIADYFQSVAPWLYRGLYAASWQILGIEPRQLVLILPPILGLVAVVYSVLLCRQLCAHPLAAGLAGMLCAQTLWMEDDLVSATPRAFAIPLLLAFLYYLERRNPWGCGLTLVAQAGLYPPAALMAWGTASLRLGDRRNRWVWIVATVALVMGLLPLVLLPAPFGPSISRQAAASMVEFQAIGNDYGRAFFFHDNPLIFWGVGVRSGLLFWGLMAPLNLTVLAWPWIKPASTATNRAVPSVSAPSVSAPSTSPERRATPSPNWPRKSLADPGLPGLKDTLNSPPHPYRLLGQLAGSIVLCYGLAHLTLFHLHFPGRYPYHGFRTLLPIAGAIALTTVITQQLSRWHRPCNWRHRSVLLALGSVQLVLLLLPFYPDLSVQNQLYTTGKAEALYAFLQTTPPDTLVATLDKEGNNLPFYTGRSTLVSKEYALPYHPQYYAGIKQRAKDLLAAHTAVMPGPLQDLIDQYAVTYLLVRDDSFTADYLWDKIWLRPFQPEFNQARQRLEHAETSGEAVLLQRLTPDCTALRTRNLSLVDAACLRQRLETETF